MAKKNLYRNERFSAFIRWLVSDLLNALYRIRVSGRANIPERGPFLLIGNHEHVFDPLVIQKHVKPWVYWVTKKELYDIPVIRGILRGIGTIPFDRDQIDIAALRQIITVVREGEVVGIFPQGRRVAAAERDVLRPKAATAHLARRFNIPILPVAVENGFKLFGPKRPHLIFGKPFSVDSLSEADDTAVIQMMRIVYGQMGQPYFPQLEV